MGRWLAPVIGVLLLAACAGTTSTAASSIDVVAGENFWGSLVTQLGGAKVRVQSVVTDPNADPHEYESSTNDARAFAEARLVILNGAGYDDWGQKLLDANKASSREVIKVAELVGKKEGDNPHFWYNPAYVTQVADKITSTLKSIDAADAGYFDQQRSQLTIAFRPYLEAVANINQKYSGVPIGATESIFAYMATALGLNLTTPPEFMNAVAEGNDPPAASVAQFQDQIVKKQARVLVYNRQTSTAVTTNLKVLAAQAGIPTVGVTETIQPPDATFQQWFGAELDQLQNALNVNALSGR